MSLLDPSIGGHGPPAGDLDKASRALESLVIKQLLTASGAFKGSSEAGGSLVADLFAETLADAVASAGGIGLGAMASKGLPRETPELGLASPVPGAALTSRYGPRSDPFDGQKSQHAGLDLAAKEGSPIRAARGGVVVAAGARGGYGNVVELDHGGGLHTLYAHASQLLVREGERVAGGQPIAEVGQTGRATGAHLHFEVRVRGQSINPARALKIYGERAEE